MGTTVKNLARSALAAALGTAVLLLNSIIPWGKLAGVCVASVFVVLVRMSCGLRWALCCYAATAALGLLLLPVKSPALLYAAFLGYYPLIKLALERLSHPALRWGLKLAVCSAVFAAAFFLLRELFITVPLEGVWGVLLAFAAADAAFCVYDYALTQIILIYMRKIQGRLK